MHSPTLGAVGLVIGFFVGLTGMGGGALLTSVLVLGFGIPPLAAISNDLFASLIMKPFAVPVHLRRRTVHWRLAGLLALGSVPSAFLGAVLVGVLGHAAAVQNNLKFAIGVGLTLSVVFTLVRQAIERRRQRPIATDDLPLTTRPVPTVLIGVLGGLLVGLTSVGAGAVMMAALVIVYPALRPNQLVGTDIVQAIPLVAAATLGHLLFGDVRLALTGSLVLGAIPGVMLGALLSSRSPAAIIRPAFTAVLTASALALLHATIIVISLVAAFALTASVLLTTAKPRITVTA
ncbi:sulfite exporter TauE/SafE family protein [Nocardia sp. NPDC101769]|uniref:sulfite exporter TauE/SafE family protein n=1 Tax=Nocardia sp. NPDC101769 TaxID=3364333 RepID=UPI0038093FB1